MIKIFELLYGLSKPIIKKMRTRELDDVERQLASVEKDAARHGMSDKNREQFLATRNAIREEKGIRAIKDEEYGIIQDEIRGASELIPVDKSIGGIKDLARAYKGVFTGRGGASEAGTKVGDLGRAYKGVFTGRGGTKVGDLLTPPLTQTGRQITKARGGDDVIPEFSTKNLTKVEVESGVPGQAYSLDERAGWMGPRISEQGNPLKLKDITFSQLDETQQGVYKIVKEADIPELSDPGVLSDLLDYTRRAGRGRSPNEVVSEYWETKGKDIREYLDIRTTTGEIPPGMTMEDFLGL
jgi:hypothetical protein